MPVFAVEQGSTCNECFDALRRKGEADGYGLKCLDCPHGVSIVNYCRRLNASHNNGADPSTDKIKGGKAHAGDVEVFKER